MTNPARSPQRAGHTWNKRVDDPVPSWVFGCQGRQIEDAHCGLGANEGAYGLCAALTSPIASPGLIETAEGSSPQAAVDANAADASTDGWFGGTARGHSSPRPHSCSVD